MKHFIIPDCQIKPGVPNKHLSWVGNYIAEKRPDVIVCLGDFADMPSLSSFDVGKAASEGQRYEKDIKAARIGMELLTKPFRDIKDYKPKMVLTLGNHEDRIDREGEANPRYKGLFTSKALGYEQFGWRVIPYLKVVRINDIEYVHYFTSGVMGRPIQRAVGILNERHHSGVMGHLQITDIAFHKKSGHLGIIAGVCNLHSENYLGPQGNTYRRQVIMLHEVRGGTADPMFVSLHFLKSKYSK